MRILFDATNFFNGSGQDAINNILINLLKIDESNNYLIVLNNKDKTKFPINGSNIKLVYVSRPSGLICNTLLIPKLIRSEEIDLGIFITFNPVFGNYKKLVILWDIIYKTHPENFSTLEKIYFSPIKYLTQYVDRIITISNYQKNNLIKYGFGKFENIDVIPMGVSEKIGEYYPDVEKNNIIEKYSLPPKFILYVGRLNYRKNIDKLIKSMKYVLDNDLKLVIVGEYDWKTINLQTIVAELDLRERVLFTGYVPREDLIKLYSMASIFCYISKEEGFGIPTIEALAAGIPIVVSDIEVFHEILGEAANYVDPENPMDIGSKINTILFDEELRNKKIKKGLDIVKKYSWAKSAKALKNIIDSVTIG